MHKVEKAKAMAIEAESKHVLLAPHQIVLRPLVAGWWLATRRRLARTAS